MDIVFLSFANSQSAPLPTLQMEDDNLYRALTPGALKQHFLLHRDSFATIEKIAEYLTLYKEHISIFHYGGHAGRDALELGTEAAHAGGIAHLLGQCSKVKLVVLNGCSTRAQVELLLAKGVPLVIATSAPVGDEKAARFASRFYQTLAQHFSIGEAFEMAIGEIQTMDSEMANRVGRQFGFEDEEENAPLWGMYYLPENEYRLKEKLPSQNRPIVQEDYVPNKKLIEALWESFPQYSDHIRELSSRKLVTQARKRMAILNSLPAPVAEHLRKLLVPVVEENQGFDKISVARLEQIVRTYQTIIELMTFTMMAQLWETFLQEENLQLSPHQVQVIQDYLNLNPNDLDTYNYTDLIRQILEIIRRNEGRYFVEELEQIKHLFYDESDFQSACFFLEVLRIKFARQSLATDEVGELCIRAEENLAMMLSHLGFMTKYALVAIQNIDVLKFRHSTKARFNHIAVVLRDLLGGLEITELELDSFMDNRSIVLLNEENMKFLSLSPFIIDANAFKKNTDVSKIYFLSHYEPHSDSYYFKYIKKPDDRQSNLHVFADQYQIIKLQLDTFKQLLSQYSHEESV